MRKKIGSADVPTGPHVREGDEGTASENKTRDRAFDSRDKGDL